MDEYQKDLQEETNYLEKIVMFIKNELEIKDTSLTEKKKELIAARKDMWENTVHYTNDFARLTEINQYLAEVNIQAAIYSKDYKHLNKYKNIIGTPYFGRFDFLEDGTENSEKFYIGLYSVIDSNTHDIYIYDWRAPISSIFYQYELGRAEFKAPSGIITGNVELKRQYKIQDSKLKYFFDSNIRINDEILQEVLSHNASSKMRNIVETIQKEQDIIIRDIDNELLMVQGVAGSGKTSIALHRIAFLLYEGLNTNLSSNNVIIISPNAVFSKYISTVLPGLGEENVEQTTFDDISAKVFGNRFLIETKDIQLESIINFGETRVGKDKRTSMDFKGSKIFVNILNSFIRQYEHNMIPFEDVYFKGKLLATKQQLKNRFLNNKILPMVKQLKRLEQMLLDKLHPLQKERLKKIEEVVQQSEGRDLEIKSFSRLLSIKEAKIFLNRLHRFTEVDYLYLYEKLFNDKELLFRMAQGQELPDNIEKIIETTRERLRKRELCYEDLAPLLYIKLKIEGNEMFTNIKQVVIDEAQDYNSMQYEVFKLLFNDAQYTVLGDINQTIGKLTNPNLYDDIIETLNKQKYTKLILNKGYRSSYEISAFAQKLLDSKQDFLAFERHEIEPTVTKIASTDLIDQKIINDINKFTDEGFQSIAIICKTQKEATNAHANLKSTLNITLIQPHTGNIEKGVSVIPSYMAKGLEFDVVIIYNANKNNYFNVLDKNLLYVACTRALHRLVIYHTDVKSPFLP